MPSESPPDVSPEALHDRIAAIWRAESGAVTAAVARRVRDVAVAEDLAQETLLAALQHWPVQGLPDRPGAWLMTTALNRAIDHLRQRQLHAVKHEAMGRDLEALQADRVPDIADQIDARREDELGDDQLRLIFTACHPALSNEARVALTLRLLGGLSTAEIARAYLTTEATVAQRIVRAKRTLGELRPAFVLPPPAEREERLDAVLEVIYLIFNEGHSATAGEAGVRTELCAEALRLAHVLARGMPQEPEVLGLLALMELQASRLAARIDEHGRPVRLLDQDRGRWDRLQIRRGLVALDHALALAHGEQGTGPGVGPYTLQAAIAACHARAPTAGDTDWRRIVGLYDGLYRLMPTPVVALNRAVAVGMSDGPEAALRLVEALSETPALKRYPWLYSVRGDLLERLGHGRQAAQAFEQAASFSQNPSERDALSARADRLRGH